MIKKQIMNFLEYLETKKRRTTRTVRNYNLYLRRFRDFTDAKKIIDVEGITAEVVSKYQTWLRAFAPDKKQIKSNTINYHLIALRAFLKYLAHKKLTVLSPAKVRLSRHEHGKAVYISNLELEKLLKAPAQFATEKIIRLRDTAILEILYCTGVKVSEIAAAKKNNVDFKKRNITVCCGEEKERGASLSNHAAYSLQQYLNERKDDTPALFLGHDRTQASRKAKKQLGALTARSIERIIERHGRLAGISTKVTPQVLRNTFAFQHVQRGTLQETLQEDLGCSSSTTTKRFYS